MKAKHKSTESSANGASTQVSQIIRAPCKIVYEACLDPEAVSVWRIPENMKCHVYAFDAREGGRFRISLTYLDPEHSAGGKTSENADTYRGRFVELVPYEKIVEVIEFETTDPKFEGEMKQHMGGTFFDQKKLIFCEVPDWVWDRY